MAMFIYGYLACIVTIGAGVTMFILLTNSAVKKSTSMHDEVRNHLNKMTENNRVSS